jgi:hypothetical protein
MAAEVSGMLSVYWVCLKLDGTCDYAALGAGLSPFVYDDTGIH